MIINLDSPDHDRCSLRMCEACNGRPLPGARQTSPHGRQTGGPRLKHCHPTITTASPPLSTGLVSRGSPSPDPRARN